MLMRLVPWVVLTILLTGCASTHMKQYMGQDIREVIIESGPPMNAFDMGDGQRAFQFLWGGGTVALPQITTGSGQVTAIGNAAWYSGTAITSGGGVYHSDGCVLTYLTRWDESRHGWVVVAYRYPQRMFC